jgi:DNA repair protein RecN (Recombination protein N)
MPVLTELHISEFALIEELQAEFGRGLTVLTGETGAGKSIIIDALSAAVGDRVASETIRTGADRAIVEATFDAADAPQALAIAAEAGVETDPEGTLILTRVVNSSGRHRCRVNGQSVPAALLRRIGDRLVDIHGQHEHQALIHERNHLQFLDTFAGAGHLARRAEYARAYDAFRRAQAARERLAAAARDRLQQLDVLRFQLEEIDAAGLAPEEEEQLLATRTRLANAERLSGGVQAAHMLVAGDPTEGLAALDAMREAVRGLQELAHIDRGLDGVASSLETTAYQLEDVAHKLTDYLDSVEADPRTLDEMEERLGLMARLKRKYGDSVAEILDFAEKARARLVDLESADERLAELDAEVACLAAEAGKLAVELSAGRQEAAERLSEALTRDVADVGMKHGRLEVELRRVPATEGLPDGEGGCWEADESGIDQGRFLFTANPGEPLKPLAAIASGGELSRIMLVLRSLCSRSDEIPTVAFDEIDAGIGGKATHAVGEKLAQVSRRAQVLCVTHLPQIARLADHHMHADKTMVKGRAHVAVHGLDEQARVAEVARMLGAREGDRAALQHASELLADGAADRAKARKAVES